MLVLADDFAMEMTQGPALHGPAGSSPGWLARYPRGYVALAGATPVPAG